MESVVNLKLKMFVFNFIGYSLILVLNVFAQESSENKHFKCVSFHRYATLTISIILKDVPKNLERPELEHPDLVYSNENYLTFHNESYFKFEDVLITNSRDKSFLNVNFYYDGYARVKIPLVKFILEKNYSVPVDNTCSNICKLEFDVWDYLRSDLGYSKWITANFLRNEQNETSSRHILHGPQNIKIREWEVVTIKAVLKNIPSQIHSVSLFYSTSKVSPTGTKVVMDHADTHFNKFSFTLFPSYENHTKILIRLVDEKNVIVSEDKKFVDFIRDPKKETHKSDDCFDECIIVYDFNKERNESKFKLDFILSVPSNVCTAHVNRRQHQNSKIRRTHISTTTPKIIEGKRRITNAGTKTNRTEETTIKSTIGTTIKTIEEITTKTTERITMETDKASPNNLAISLPSVAAVLVILLLTVGIVLYRRQKVPTPVNDDTYLYASQLNYAQLQLGSSELYEAPQTDYVSAYTHVIGVLKPILEEKEERKT